MKKEEDTGRWPCEDLLRVLSVSGDSEEAAFQTAATLKLQSDKPRDRKKQGLRSSHCCVSVCVRQH